MSSFVSKRHLLSFWFKPSETFRQIGVLEHATWLAPLLVILAAVLLRTVAIGLMSQPSQPDVMMPMDYQFYLPEEQERLQNALAISRGPLFVYFFPIVGNLLGFWLQWLVLSAFIYLGLRIGRSKCRGRLVRSFTAWASLPLALRFIVQAVFILVSQRPIYQSGLASLVTPTPGMTIDVVGMVLSAIDFYFLWQLVLLVKGSQIVGGVRLWKALPVVVIALGIVIVLSAAAGMVTAQLGGLLAG